MRTRSPRLVEGCVNLVDRGLHEDRRIIGNAVVEVFREAAGELLRFRPDLLANLQRIGIWRLINGYPRGGPPIEQALLRIGLRAKLDSARRPSLSRGDRLERSGL